ncbi:MAG: hypothetical protein AB7G28_09570 [Pirellulales bacterium]
MATFTLIHVAISLLALAAGFVVLGGMLCGTNLRGWTGLFLVTTIATNASGFGFPFVKFLPSHAIAILSLALLAVAVYALYVRHLAGGWRLVYFVTAVAALYFNAFVLIVQTFLKFPVLHELAPNQTEPPFAITQALLLLGFIVSGFAAWKRFKLAPV